ERHRFAPFSLQLRASALKWELSRLLRLPVLAVPWTGYLLTRPHPKIAATSISATNLADGLWSEVAKWQAKSELLKTKFTWTKTRIFSNEHPETWFMAFKSWSRSADANEQANTLAGFHADYVLFLLDRRHRGHGGNY